MVWRRVPVPLEYRDGSGGTPIYAIPDTPHQPPHQPPYRPPYRPSGARVVISARSATRPNECGRGAERRCRSRDQICSRDWPGPNTRSTNTSPAVRSVPVSGATTYRMRCPSTGRSRTPSCSPIGPEVTKRPVLTVKQTKQERHAALSARPGTTRSGLNPSVFSDLPCCAAQT